MCVQVTVEIDVRQYANAEQSAIFAEPTTDFFGMQLFLLDREAVSLEQVSHEQPSELRREVIESLERSLVEYGDVWAELAKY